MQRQHRGDDAAIVGDKQAPALLDFERNPRTQFREQEVTGVLKPRRCPAVHPDAGDLVIFVRPGGTDRWRRHSNWSIKEKAPATLSRGLTNSNQKRIIHSAATYAIPNRRESGEVVAVEVHHLVPGRHEIFHKLLLRVRARIDFCKGPELGVRTEDQVNTGAGPLDRLRLAVPPLV